MPEDTGASLMEHSLGERRRTSEGERNCSLPRIQLEGKQHLPPGPENLISQGRSVCKTQG